MASDHLDYAPTEPLWKDLIALATFSSDTESKGNSLSEKGEMRCRMLSEEDLWVASLKGAMVTYGWRH